MLVYFHNDCLLKDNGFNHPERKENFSVDAAAVPSTTGNTAAGKVFGRAPRIHLLDILIYCFLLLKKLFLKYGCHKKNRGRSHELTQL